MGSSTRPIVAILVAAAAAIAFWTLALSPKRDEADKLAQQVEQLSAGVEQAQGELAQATTARRSFPAAYRQLVELGQAVPAGDEMPSLLIELENLAARSGVEFESIQLEGEGEAAPEAPAASSTSTGVPAAETVPPTELEASLLPLGASIGPAGLAVMPYSLQFKGNFFGIASFIGKVDALVKPGSSRMKVDGRLVTIKGFSLTTSTAEGEGGSTGGPIQLQADFSVTTYLTPPGQGITAGASPTAPASEPSTQTVAAR
ncbi:MAG TPA: type 4a pilus biogenesis protein PilO [Solirubrobacterales bacterium]|jgi:Tfp pilus assembly protein PilO|nr:type 4a pilus biogenesis protein PilO [Solirubrobacterales bacterium]